MFKIKKQMLETNLLDTFTNIKMHALLNAWWQMKLQRQIFKETYIDF